MRTGSGAGPWAFCQLPSFSGPPLLLLALSGCRAGNDASRPSDVARPVAPSSGVENAPRANVTPDPPPTDARAPAQRVGQNVVSQPPPETDWCIETMRVLDETTCYVLPEPQSSVLIIYFHGIVPPEKTSVQKTNLETVLANAAHRARAAALLPRGKQGFAPRGHERWWGWPTGEPAYGRHAPELLAMVSEKREKLERLAGAAFQRVYLAGSSSGAYFVAVVALRGAFPADGFAALSGGSGSITPELAQLPPKPFYIGYGSQDSVGPGARALSELLRGAGWPVKIAAHPVGHGAKEVYLDEAFAFWRTHAPM